MKFCKNCKYVFTKNCEKYECHFNVIKKYNHITGKKEFIQSEKYKDCVRNKNLNCPSYKFNIWNALDNFIIINI